MLQFVKKLAGKIPKVFKIYIITPIKIPRNPTPAKIAVRDPRNIAWKTIINMINAEINVNAVETIIAVE